MMVRSEAWIPLAIIALAPALALPRSVAAGASPPAIHRSAFEDARLPESSLQPALAGGRAALPAWTGESNQIGAEYGQTVASAGDVNGDGLADIIVGAPLYDATYGNAGRAYVYLGRPDGVSPTPCWIADGDQGYCEFGSTVASAGDVNRDGYDDVLVSSPYHGGTHYSGEGRVYLYLGGPSGPSPSADWMAEGGQYAAELGFGLAGAGDVNGDGYDDVIVGAHLFDGPAGTDEGRALVYLGRPSGLSPTPVWTAGSGLAGSIFGWCVSSGGDVNNDGYDDVLVGAPGYGDGKDDASSGGRAFLYLGSPSGPHPAADWQAGTGQRYASFGYCVASAGDINGDGHDDVLVGAFSHDGCGSDDGAAYVFLGADTGLPAEPAAVLGNCTNGSWYGYSVAGAGDINRDGYGDVLVGAPLNHFPITHEGSVYLFLGGPGGLQPEEFWMESGGQAEGYYGGAVAGAGDVNGDSYADILIGAIGYDNGEVDEGRAYVYLGPDCGEPPSSTPEAGPSVSLGLRCPNPFAPGNALTCDLPRTERTALAIWDLRGRLVARLALDGEAGRHQVIWSGGDTAGRKVAPGVYFARLQAGSSVLVRKMVLLGGR